MLVTLLAAYIDAVLNGPAALLVLMGSIGAWMGMLWWGVRGDAVRRALFIAALLSTMVGCVFYGFLLTRGLVSGMYFHEVPPALQAATLVPLLQVLALAWLFGYRWLKGRGWPALAAAVAFILVIAELIALADARELGGGYFVLGPDGSLWLNVLGVGGLLLLPLLMYEAAVRLLSSDLLP